MSRHHPSPSGAERVHLYEFVWEALILGKGNSKTTTYTYFILLLNIDFRFFSSVKCFLNGISISLLTELCSLCENSICLETYAAARICMYLIPDLKKKK